MNMLDLSLMAKNHAATSSVEKTADPVRRSDLAKGEKLSPEAQAIEDRLQDAEARIEALPGDANMWNDPVAAAAWADYHEAKGDAIASDEHPDDGRAREAANHGAIAHELRDMHRHPEGEAQR